MRSDLLNESEDDVIHSDDVTLPPPTSTRRAVVKVMQDLFVTLIEHRFDSNMSNIPFQGPRAGRSYGHRLHFGFTLGALLEIDSPKSDYADILAQLH